MKKNLIYKRVCCSLFLANSLLDFLRLNFTGKYVSFFCIIRKFIMSFSTNIFPVIFSFLFLCLRVSFKLLSIYENILSFINSCHSFFCLFVCLSVLLILFLTSHLFCFEILHISLSQALCVSASLFFLLSISHFFLFCLRTAFVTILNPLAVVLHQGHVL